MPTPVRRAAALVATAVLAVTLASCGLWSSQETSVAVPGGDVERGRDAAREFGCVSCHSIPGVAAPPAHVGPPLDDWAKRRYIAGRLANTPENLVAWLLSPQSIDPQTAMPNVGLSEEDARDIAAYLYTLD
jgi:cytochrome c